MKTLEFDWFLTKEQSQRRSPHFEHTSLAWTTLLFVVSSMKQTIKKKSNNELFWVPYRSTHGNFFVNIAYRYFSCSDDEHLQRHVLIISLVFFSQNLLRFIRFGPVWCRSVERVRSQVSMHPPCINTSTMYQYMHHVSIHHVNHVLIHQPLHRPCINTSGMYRYIKYILMHPPCIDTYIFYWHIHHVSIYWPCIDRFTMYQYINHASIDSPCIDTSTMHRYIHNVSIPPPYIDTSTMYRFIYNV